jgi:hypothetical protein
MQGGPDHRAPGQKAGQKTRMGAMPAFSGIEIRHGSCHFVPLLCVSATDLSDGRHNFPGHAEALGDVVPRDVVCNESEEWSQRARVQRV